MALLLKAPACVGARGAVKSLSPLRVTSIRRVVQVRASKDAQEAAVTEFGKAAACLSVASSWMMAGNAQAATELAQLAGDNRIGSLALLFLPALGWVAFNIFQPALNQLGRMDELKDGAVAGAGKAKRRSVAGAVGLGAALSLFAAQQADAAQEVAQLAGDNRISSLALLFLPALGWVAFNIFQPALNQLGRMDELKEGASSSKPKRR